MLMNMNWNICNFISASHRVSFFLLLAVIQFPTGPCYFFLFVAMKHVLVHWGLRTVWWEGHISPRWRSLSFMCSSDTNLDASVSTAPFYCNMHPQRSINPSCNSIRVSLLHLAAPLPPTPLHYHPKAWDRPFISIPVECGYLKIVFRV